MPSTDKLENALGYSFHDRLLLQQALTHRSVGNHNNERLEFLGDALLGGIMADELFRRFPDAREGRLSRLRATLVRRESLADIARSLQIGQFMRLGPGERKSGGHRRDSIMSDALEALFGAIFLDAGYEPCRKIILRLFAGKLDSLTETVVLKDPKTRLQEFLQSHHRPLPQYAVLKIEGEPHAQRFRVECSVPDNPATHGEAGSRRQAEQQAAELMLLQLTG